MVGLSEKAIEALKKKAGFIKVCWKDGYNEYWISVNELIEEYLKLKKEKETENTNV